MNVVHISLTPLAGAPIRLVNALRKFERINARLINLNPHAYGDRTFPEDLSWENDKELCLDLIRKADILHFHHEIDIENVDNHFGINFKEFAPTRCKFIFQSHSAPVDLKEKNDQKARLVIPHFPERYFPQARVVPNIIDLDASIPFDRGEKILGVFAPSRVFETAWSHRWDTKAAPEIISILNRYRKNNEEWRIIKNKPFLECIQEKSNADIILEENVTGSYHQGSLEGIALGKAVVCYLDSRSRYILDRLLGTNIIPFMNIRMENLEEKLPEILLSRSFLLEKGRESRRWFEQYYNPQALISFYKKAYLDILMSTEHFQEQTLKEREYDFKEEIKRATIISSELEWRQRRMKNFTWSDLQAIRRNKSHKIYNDIKRHIPQKIKVFFKTVSRKSKRGS